VRGALRNANISQPDTEARILCQYAAGVSAAKFLAIRTTYPHDHNFEIKISDGLERRLNGEPLAYITGEWEFLSVPIIVSRETLIPRPATETLAERVIEIAKKIEKPRILDLCCGSGCIGIACAMNLPQATVVLSDKSVKALEIAKKNIKACALTRRVSAVEADALGRPPALGSIDIIACNPPYIKTGDIQDLDDSVAKYEPRGALDGGEDGLDFYRAIAENWRALLRVNGHLLFETGYDQSADVSEILQILDYRDIIILKDASGIKRVVECRI